MSMKVVFGFFIDDQPLKARWRLNEHFCFVDLHHFKFKMWYKSTKYYL